MTGDETVFVGNDPETDLKGAAGLGLRAVDVASLATLADLPSRLIVGSADSAAAEVAQESNT